MKYIEIKGARVNNLKNVTVKIPLNSFTVITGLSGSGKSSLAFDTLYAEGQRRYVESLSAYARQFLGKMNKPEVDFIRNIPPTIAIEQKVINRNARSTVGTSTEIYDYLRLLFARVGRTISPISGEEVKRHTAQDVMDFVQTFPEGTRFLLLCPRQMSTRADLESLMRQGYSRLEVTLSDGPQMLRIDDVLEDEALLEACLQAESKYLIIDRLSVQNDTLSLSRLNDSVETAFYEGQHACALRIYAEDGEVFKTFSDRFEADGIAFEEPTDLMFNFNSPSGACPTCEGFGRVVGLDEDLIVPDKSLSIYDDAIACWRGQVMGEWKKALVMSAPKFDFPIFKPWYQLTQAQRDLVWSGNRYFHGLYEFFQRLEEKQYKVQNRVMLARYRGKTICPDCKGRRLKPAAFYVKVGGKSIADLVEMPISDLLVFFNDLQLTENESLVAERLLLEIRKRLQFLMDVGLSYLRLDRLSNTLSGGESQRINLVTSLGSSLVGSLYVLDEPSIGLHARDTDRLIKVLRQLQALGNTVVVVEHDEEMIRAADYIIDIGPDAGRLGGQLVYQGALAPLLKNGAALLEGDMMSSHTLNYITGREEIALPAYRRSWNNFIQLKGVCHHNLKEIDVKFPLNVMTVVTGVSGSGKSSLVRDVFYVALKRKLSESSERPGTFREISGDFDRVYDIEFVDQNPIGKSSRSNPATYLKVYDEIRKLFADQPLAKQMGMTASYFSFNQEGGRCEHCQGEGVVHVDMQFMADIVMTCEHCQGKRFQSDVLEVLYKGKSIYDVLEMTVNQACEFFAEAKTSAEKKILKRLQPLKTVGLGYVKLGQSSSTLSGGESQRVKLAYYLSQEQPKPSVFIFDEPTTGLHFHDIHVLLKALNDLIAAGHTVIIIEHNLEVIKCADHIIELGPEGGNAGGELLFAGTPEDLLQCERSHTAKFLKEKMTK
ncbi:MAG: excinuclease ABC subunit UvrA [Bacteroidales bacterium]|nr:excinuclease ABC subunit UvrA [Bacteroidales bacterium]